MDAFQDSDSGQTYRTHKRHVIALQDPAYWASWAITHWSTMAASGVLCAWVGTYPFSHSSASVRHSNITLNFLSSVWTWFPEYISHIGPKNLNCSHGLPVVQCEIQLALKL